MIVKYPNCDFFLGVCGGGFLVIGDQVCRVE